MTPTDGPARPRLLRRALARLVGSDDAPPVDDEARPARPFPIGAAQPRRRIDCLGTVTTTAVVEQPGGPWLEAKLSDGTGQVTLVWLGRTELAGVVPGRRLHVVGRLVPDRGRLVVFNPDYALLAPDPAAAPRG